MRAILIIVSAVFFSMVTHLSVSAQQDTSQAQVKPPEPSLEYILKPTTGVNELKKKCIEAAIKGMLLDKEKLESWIEMRRDKDNMQAELFELKGKLDQLETNIFQYSNNPIANYELPEKLEIEAWVLGDQARENGQISFHEQSESGPFYHMTGINGEDYGVIQATDYGYDVKPKNTFIMTVYPVWKREYSFPDYYVYVDAIRSK